MDCAQGLVFTGEVFAPAAWGAPPAADANVCAPVQMWVAPLAPIVVLRWLAVVLVWRGWLRRYGVCKARRLPLYPLVASVGALTTSAVLVLASMGGGSGTGPVIFCLVCTMSFCFQICSSMTVSMYVRVGGKIIGGLTDAAGVTKSFNPTRSRLLRLLFLAAHGANYLFIVLIILMNLQINLDYRAFYFDLACAEIFILSAIICIIQQAIIMAMRGFVEANKSAVDLLVKGKVTSIRKKVRELRKAQLVYSALSAGFIIVGLLFGARILSNDIAAVDLPFFFDCFGILFGAVSLIPDSKRHSKQLSRHRSKNAPRPSNFRRSSAGGSAVIIRAGQENLRKDLTALQEEFKDATVVFDDGKDVSVIAEHVIIVDEDDILMMDLLARFLGPEKAKKIVDFVFRVVCATLLPSEWTGQGLLIPVLFWCVVGGSGLVLIGIVLCEVGPPWLAFVFPLFGLTEMFLVGCVMSRVIFLKVLTTAHFQWRLFSSTVSVLVLGIAMNDSRSWIATSLWITQILVPLGDCFIGSIQSVRLILCFVCLLAEMLVVLLIVTGLVPSDNPIITISAVFDYSFMQLVRDMLLAQIVILVFELVSLTRNAHSRRFIHLTQGVAFSIRPITFDSLEAVPNLRKARRIFHGGKFHGDVSQLEVKSGFFVKQDRNRQPDAKQQDGQEASRLSGVSEEEKEVPEICVYVNQVEVKQEDSVAIHVLGVDRGIRFFEMCIGPWSKFVVTLCYLLGWMSLLVFPWLNGNPTGGDGLVFPWWLPMMSLLATAGILLRNLAIMSRSLAKLLVRRWHFVTSVVFLCIWLGLICLILRDARICWALFCFTGAFLELFVDAHLSIPRRAGALSRVWLKLNSGLFFAVISGFMVFGQVSSPHAFIIFRPGLVVNGSINSDSPFVIDLFQSTVDLQISFALQRLAVTAYLLYINRPQMFQMIASPMQAKYTNVHQVQPPLRIFRGEKAAVVAS